MNLEINGVSYPLAFNQLTVEEAARKCAVNATGTAVVYAVTWAALVSGAYVEGKELAKPVGDSSEPLTFADVIEAVDVMLGEDEGAKKLREIITASNESTAFKRIIGKDEPADEEKKTESELS